MDDTKSQLEAKYGSLKEVRINDRFATYSATVEKERVFIKVAVKAELRERLRAEAAGLMAMRELDLGQKFYRVPRVIDLTETYIVTEWATGHTMQSQSHYSYLQKLYAMIDSRSKGETGITRYNQPHERSGVDIFLERMDKVDYTHYFDSKLVKSTADFIRTTLPVTETRFTNGDLQPGNLLVDDSTIWLIDCETASWLWPRHYNIVNFMFNTASQNDMTIPALHKLFEGYCIDIGLNGIEHIPAFNVSAALRCFGQIIEHLSNQEINTHQPIISPSNQKYIQESMEKIVAGKLFLY